jgi:hypothetical protein
MSGLPKGKKNGELLKVMNMMLNLLANYYNEAKFCLINDF